MAAIARFISFDGGIAFSTASLKIQKRDEDRGKIIPVAEIAALEVSEPLFGDDGSIAVRLNGEWRASGDYTLYFDDEQYGDAVQFKVAFDTMREESRAALPPLDMFQPEALAPAPAGKASPRGAQRPTRTRPEVRREYEEPARPQRRRAGKKGGKLKKIAIYSTVAVLGLGAIGLLFDMGEQKEAAGEGVLEIEPTAEVSEAWLPEDVAPSSDEFLAAAQTAASGALGEGERITDFSLNDGDLNISIDCSGVPHPEEYDDLYVQVISDQVVEPVLALGEQYDGLWDTMTVDYGQYGKVVKNKADIQVWNDEANGVYNRRYFEPVNETVIHDEAPVVVGYTSPPAATDPPVTAAPQQQTERLVWIPTNGGSKYHSKSSCSGMDGPIQVTISEAEKQGFTPCGKCY